MIHVLQLAENAKALAQLMGQLTYYYLDMDIALDICINATKIINDGIAGYEKIQKNTVNASAYIGAILVTQDIIKDLVRLLQDADCVSYFIKKINEVNDSSLDWIISMITGNLPKETKTVYALVFDGKKFRVKFNLTGDIVISYFPVTTSYTKFFNKLTKRFNRITCLVALLQKVYTKPSTYHAAAEFAQQVYKECSKNRSEDAEPWGMCAYALKFFNIGS